MIELFRSSRLGLCVVALGVALFSASTLRADALPDWKFKVAETDVAEFETPQLFAKDYGWLLTFRMRVKALSLIKPVSEVSFKGYDAEKEVVWEKEHTIRRKDFEAAYGGGRSQFVRVLLKDIPEEVTLVMLHYGDEETAVEDAAAEE